MITNTVHLSHVELFGFTERERMVFASMFKLSEMRSRTYAEWNGTEPAKPDCLLLDLDAPNASMRCDKEVALPGGYPIIVVGSKLPLGMKPDGHLQRPVRWAELLIVLDNVFRAEMTVEAEQPAAIAEQAALAEALPPETIDAQNELELQQVEPWYDRSEKRTFKTDPAVLVVDSDNSMQHYIVAKLAGLQYRVDYAAAGDKALDLIEMNRYNVVFLSPELGDMDGYQIAKHIKQREDRRRIATVALSTKNNPIERVRANLAGCDAFLAKPVNPEKLVALLEKFLPDWKLEQSA